MSQAWQQPRLQDFLTKMRAREGLVPNLDHETIKNENENMAHVKQKSNKILLQIYIYIYMTRKHTQT